ncbi:protein ASPARTIC PROTEASE IN GUARD CELL 1 [Sesamum angolense]|uniref:Protein ASPARTIC PROTEASE IN GUARD CELL 1 n=1 Tax=Sesamum angolense TaxID=2727404 RepID=A0AAE1W3Y4_9LAMI|nr:protein ASPARTIC PROTEASE IN GUARD CELL 1 [Sesamum angolense]
MVSKSLLVVGYFYLFCYGLFVARNGVLGLSYLNSDDASPFLAIELPAADSSSVDSGRTDGGAQSETPISWEKKEAQGVGLESTAKDLNRIQTLHTRIIERRVRNSISRMTRDDTRRASGPSPKFNTGGFSGQLMATLKSGVSLGSGEYLMDVFVGTPPKHYSLILDTGSDLNWIQCKPCRDCFEQKGPYYDPMQSSSYRNIACKDPVAGLYRPLIPHSLARLRLRVVLITTGLGRGPLSFASQLQSLYGDSFSYCLLSRNSNMSSKLIFGEDKGLLSHPDLNFTTLVAGKENPVSTFYYVQIKSVVVGGEKLNIPEQMWSMSADGAGGTIVDSGTTLSYFADPAYKIIKEAFEEKVKGYQAVKDFPIMDPCYNVSGVDKLDLPSFSFVFADGAVWNFPVENYFIKLEPENVVCLAILGTPRSALSIIGNYQQQNFHILYDMKRSRLGFALTNCADI